MTAAAITTPSRPPLRLWPGVAAVAVQWLLWLALPRLVPTFTAGMIGALGALACGLLVAVWWVFFSRAPRAERWGALVLTAVALFGASRLLHASIATAGQGVMFWVYAVPVSSLAFVAWAAATRRLGDGVRRATMAATVVLASFSWTLLRSGGVYGSGAEFSWRWSPTAEERLLASAPPDPAPRPGPAAAPTEADWPGFRGPGRDGDVPGVRIATDWQASPPVEIWRRPIGPGWSSFAVGGGRIYTQEQRGEDETVSCYDLATGAPVWRHRDVTRFWEANGGAGPRGTPTLREGRIYAFGATGRVNALDAATGAVVWSRDAAAELGVDVPYWGFSSSPLAIGELVVVAVAGRLAAYDAATGVPRWSAPDGGASYSSPHAATLGGVPQVVLLSAAGAIGVAPADGAVLWEHPWPGYPIVQPALTADGDLLIAANAESGLRRLALAHGPAGWSVAERWTSMRLKPYFNDFVVHEGRAYGFDGAILAAIDLEDGRRLWKGGRFGNGQLVLLPEQDLLLVLSEQGEIALVAAKPDRFEELARFPALDGKTWNHPVMVGDRLLVRNGREMAAFRLAATGG